MHSPYQVINEKTNDTSEDSNEEFFNAITVTVHDKSNDQVKVNLILALNGHNR